MSWTNLCAGSVTSSWFGGSPRRSALSAEENGEEKRVWFGLVYWGLTPQQQPGSYQGGEMIMKSVFWWRKPEYPEETTDLRQTRRERDGRDEERV